MGKSDLQANGRMDNYLQWWLKDSTLTGTFNVNSNQFDLNELMGPRVRCDVHRHHPCGHLHNRRCGSTE